MFHVRAVQGSIVFGLLLAVACGPRVSDTGYTGTWTREGIDVMTTITIVEQEDGYRFRWGRESDDGRLQVRCDWDGTCEERFDGELLATYRMRSWVDDESGRLRVECRGLRWEGTENETAVHYVDELIVRKDGTRLVSREYAKDGVVLEGKGHGKRIFEKYSDEVVDPPPETGDRG